MNGQFDKICGDIGTVARLSIMKQWRYQHNTAGERGGGKDEWV